MSADNYDVCPRCWALTKQRFEAGKLSFETAYGRLPDVDPGLWTRDHE